MIMEGAESTGAIAPVFDEFLTHREGRLSPSLPGHDQEEYDRISGASGSVCGTFGPEESDPARQAWNRARRWLAFSRANELQTAVPRA
jgi:hypothetical protein